VALLLGWVRCHRAHLHHPEKDQRTYHWANPDLRVTSSAQWLIAITQWWNCRLNTTWWRNYRRKKCWRGLNRFQQFSSQKSHWSVRGIQNQKQLKVENLPWSSKQGLLWEAMFCENLRYSQTTKLRRRFQPIKFGGSKLWPRKKLFFKRNSLRPFKVLWWKERNSSFLYSSKQSPWWHLRSDLYERFKRTGDAKNSANKVSSTNSTPDFCELTVQRAIDHWPHLNWSPDLAKGRKWNNEHA
jgi:hypothetical protein